MLKRGIVEVATSEDFVILRLDRTYETVFAFYENIANFRHIPDPNFSYGELTIWLDDSGGASLVGTSQYWGSKSILGQASWFLGAIGVQVDAQEFSDEDETWNFVHRLEIATPVPMKFTLPDEEIFLYAALGEPLPYLWPLERLIPWAIDRPEATLERL